MGSQDRQMRRALMLFDILNTITARTGTGSVEHVHLAALTAIADTRALWRFMLDKGLATDAQHQDYLDRGYEELRAQVEREASKIYVAEGGNG